MIGIEVDGDTVTLLFKGRPVLRHCPASPCLGLGRGGCRIEMRHGMYRLRGERLLSWKEAGTCLVVAQAPDRTVLEFPGLATLVLLVEDGKLRIVPTALLEGCNRFSLRLPLVPGESLHGCGEQFSYTDLRGHRFPLWVSESGIGRGANHVRVLADLHSGRGGSATHSYFPQPSFVSSGGLYCLAESEAYAVFDFRRADRCELAFHEVPRSIILGLGEGRGEGGGEEPRARQRSAMGDLTSLLGRQPPLPDWAYGGLWLGVQGGQAVVEGKIETALKAGIKVAAVWCQDWQGIRMTRYGKQLFWNWDYDRTLYPDLPLFIESLHARGIRFLGYNNPFLAADAPLCEEASRRGFLVKDASGGDFLTTTTTFPVSLLDLSNPGARAWMKGIIKRNMLGIGMDGWMADFGEYLPFDGVLFSGEDPGLVHNRYPVDWARLNREAIEEFRAGKAGGGGADALFFCRSGWAGSTREAALFWAGDQLVDFLPDAGLPSVLAAGLSAGMSGVGNWHFDIGGFVSVAWIRRSRELLMRSAELAAFTQVMRTHEGINPKVNSQFDSDPGMLAHFARMTAVHAALGDYHRATAADYAATGLPPIRTLGLHYRDEAGEGRRPAGRRPAGRRPTQYLYGRDLLVAPVLRSRARSATVLLPDDRWVHLWSGKRFGPGPVRVDAPLGEPPVFYREDSSWAALFETARAAASDGQRISPLKRG